jgi:NitT/TauT family transport system substrate-binding protein
MIDRRRLLAGASAVAVWAGVPIAARAGALTLRVASLRFGSLSWLLETIRAEGLDKKHGVAIDVLDVATNQAGPVALLAGEAEIIVSDWTWAMRQRSLGDKVRFYPYSAALGAVMVPKGSPVTALVDLTGMRLGVAGTAIDKSWLLLRAYSQKMLGKDIADFTRPVFGAAPLLTEEIRQGRIDAVLNFWTYAARLSAAGFTELLSMTDVLKTLGIEPVPALVGFVWREEIEAAKKEALTSFLAAVKEGNQILATNDAAWQRLRDLVKPANDAEFAALRAYYRSGIPNGWGPAETQSAERLTNLLIELGDKELMGSGTRFDPNLFYTG